MHIFERLEELIDDVLLVNVLKNIRADHGMQIRFCERDKLSTGKVPCKGRSFCEGRLHGLKERGVPMYSKTR